MVFLDWKEEKKGDLRIGKSTNGLATAQTAPYLYMALLLDINEVISLLISTNKLMLGGPPNISYNPLQGYKVRFFRE